jgi:DNA topoisomerase-1
MFKAVNKFKTKENLSRIKNLKIPPNWKNVKIATDETNKIQVIGEDNKNRKQYIYHPLWTLFAKESKYLKIESLNFEKFLKIINEKSKNSILSKDYVIANMFILMKDLNIRVGNEIYLKKNDSVGLTTMQKKNFLKNKLFFKGKKGIEHTKILDNNHINFINNLIKIPGDSLFKYKENGIYHKVNSIDLNNFLKEYVDFNMTCKDIRTFCANKIYCKKLSELLKNNDPKAKINAIKYTALQLGNTPKITKDSYLNPKLL